MSIDSCFRYGNTEYSWVNYVQNIYIALSVAVLIIITLTIKLLNKPHREMISKFLKPFGKKGNELFLGINAIIIVVCIIAIVIHIVCHNPNGGIEFSFFNLVSFLLCLFSIYLTSRVYFEIEKEKTTSLDEYLERLTDIIINSKENDEVLIIAPTIVLGQTHKNNSYTKEGYLDEILRFLEKGKIIFALLDFDYLGFNSFTVNTSLTNGNSTITYNISASDDSKRTLSDYHFETWKLYEKDELDKRMTKLQNVLLNLKSKTKATFIRLNAEMYHINTSDYTRSNGFFAIANFSEGMYYMGNFNVIGKIHKFQGTYFENKHITTQMRHMLKCAIGDFCIEEDKNELNSIYSNSDGATTTS
jgi:uncharacterized membrane protein